MKKLPESRPHPSGVRKTFTTGSGEIESVTRQVRLLKCAESRRGAQFQSGGVLDELRGRLRSLLVQGEQGEQGEQECQ